MDKARAREIFVSVGFPFILGIFCIIFAIWLLPKNCRLFVSNVAGPQMCHTLPVEPDCDSFCNDGRTEAIAALVAVFGVCVFFVPVVVYLIKERRERPVEQAKLFD
jgi:hypothetical protein